MKMIAIMLISALCVSFANAQQSYDERIYIYSTGDLTTEGAEQACDETLSYLASNLEITGLNANVWVRGKMFSVETRAHNGKLKNDKVQEIGEILACLDFDTYLPEVNTIPAYYRISVGGRTYHATGATQHPSFANTLPGGGQITSPPGYLPESIYLAENSAFILPMIPGRRGGLVTINAIYDFVQDHSDNYSSSAIHVLRVLVPKE